MKLTKITLTNFKNYTAQTVSFSPTINCIVGKNGMGKTNLLDAIYFLCMCKSNFSGSDKNVVKHDEGFFRLEGQFMRNQKKEKIVAKVIPSKQKVIEKNDVLYPKLSEHVGYLPVVMIAPADSTLVLGGSEERRKLLDNTLSQADPSYLAALLLYNKILRQRNAALKKFALTHSYNAQLIQTYNQQMQKPSQIIFEKRKIFLEEISTIFESYYKSISGNSENVSLLYKSQLMTKSLSELQKENAEKDKILARTTVGVHKDDLIFTIDEHPLKQFASQGQLKSYLLSIKLAQYGFLKKVKQLNPILLLDDIFDKLDRFRVQFLLEMLLKNDFGQIFLTDTHDSRIEEIVQSFELEYKKFVIEDGKVLD